MCPFSGVSHCLTSLLMRHVCCRPVGLLVRSSPLQSELRLLLLVLDDLTDGFSGRDDVLFDAQFWVKVHQVLVLFRGRELVTVLGL